MSKTVIKSNASIPMPPEMIATDPAFVRTLNDRLQRLSEGISAAASSQTAAGNRVTSTTTVTTIDVGAPVQLVDITI